MDKESVVPESMASHASSAQPLGTLKRGARGIVTHITNLTTDPDLERQLLEIGLVEGVRVELLHHGPFGDPVAVRIDQRLTVALRRTEANAVLVVPIA